MTNPREFARAFGKRTVAPDSKLVCKVCHQRIVKGDDMVWVVLRRNGGVGFATTARPVYVHAECETGTARRAAR